MGYEGLAISYRKRGGGGEGRGVGWEWREHFANYFAGFVFLCGSGLLLFCVLFKTGIAGGDYPLDLCEFAGSFGDAHCVCVAD